MTTEEFKKEYLVTELLEFIKIHFNHFDHRKRSGTTTWFTPSWAPFTEACFIRLGIVNKLKVGSSYTQPQLQRFWENNIPELTYNKPIDRGFDVSWHDTEFEFVLGLEHEETGNTDSNRLKCILDELVKLRHYKGKNKILISRPHFNTKQSYREIETKYKLEIEEKIKDLKPIDETWIIILIGLRNPIINQNNEILFSNYFWDKNIGKLSSFNSGCGIPIKLENNHLVLKEATS